MTAALGCWFAVDNDVAHELSRTLESLGFYSSRHVGLLLHIWLCGNFLKPHYYDTLDEDARMP